MNKGNKQWLANELPELLQKEILNQESVDKLSKHYSLDQLADEADGMSKMTIILASIGGLLIGGGIIMLLAHNWDSYGRGARMALGIVPLIIAQIFSFFAIFPKVRGAAWREASAAFMFCAVPASIAIVGQTYHISDDTQAFLTLWFVLTLPFIYLLRAQLASVLSMFLATTLAVLFYEEYWLCAAALLPFYFFKEPYGRNTQSRKIGWVFAIGLSVSLFSSTIRSLDWSQGAEALILMSIAVSLYLLGGFVEPKRGFWQRPFTNIGAVSIASLLLMFTFKDFWNYRWGLDIESLFINYFSSALFIILAAAAFFATFWKKRRDLWPMASIWLFTLFMALTYEMVSRPTIYAFASNLVAVAIAIWYIWLGIKETSSSRMNFGLLILMILILMRFFDQDFSFIVKGIAFILMGSAFIAVNLWQNKRTSKRSENEAV